MEYHKFKVIMPAINLKPDQWYSMELVAETAD